MKRLLVVFTIILIIICVDFYLKRDTSTVIKIDKTYTAQVVDCSKEVIDFFEFKDSQCIVAIEGDIKVLKDHSRYEFKGTIFINNKIYKFDDRNKFVTTKLQINGNEVFMGTNNDHSSTYKNDEVTEYLIDIYHDMNYELEKINLIASPSVVGSGTLEF